MTCHLRGDTAGSGSMTCSGLRLRSLSGPEPESGVSGSDSELSDARL